MQRTFFGLVLITICVVGASVSAQNTNSSTTGNNNSSAAVANTKKRVYTPIFRANADQIKQAQAILKQRTFYSGEQTGKLDPATRAGLKKYQGAEGLKVTGTLNKVTLEKMGVELTEKQRAM